MYSFEVTASQKALKPDGQINGPGWSRRPFWDYSRKDIKASPLRIKEWDYYAVYSHKHRFWITTTFSDLGYLGLFAIAFVDISRGSWTQVDKITSFPLGKYHLPPHSKDHEIAMSSNILRIACSRKEERRRILCGAPGLKAEGHNEGLDADITCIQTEGHESINILTSWESNRKAFYLNEKVNCMRVSGTVRLGEEVYELTPDESVAVLDWGRGRWTYQNRWYWASASTFIDSVPVGFNFGYGFSDRTDVTENAIFYDNILHKIDRVSFEIPSDSYTDPWKITSNDKRVDLTFIPVVDRNTQSNFLIIKSVQHQVFGHFSGSLVLDDNTTVQVDKMPGFAEDVFNRY